MTNITTRNNLIQTTDNKIQARDKSFKPFGVYRNAVLPIANTQIASDVNTRLLYKWLIDNNLYNDLVLAVGGDYGIQKNYIDPNWQVENAYDLSKFGNDAGQATAADQPISENNTFKFDGASDYLEIPASAESLQITGAISMSLWIKVNEYDTGQQLIGRGLGLSADGNFGYALSLFSNNRIYLDLYSETTRATLQYSNYDTLAGNNYVHLMATWSGDMAANGMKIIANGTTIKSGQSAIETMGTPEYPFRIGARANNILFTNANISDVLVFKSDIHELAPSLYNLQKSKYGY